MHNWNEQFTQLLRGSLPAHWGNWALSPDIAPGAVGILDPASGEFRLVNRKLDGLDDADILRTPLGSDWNMMTSSVSRKESSISLDGSATDPETGVKITAGVQVEWKMAKAGDMVSQCALDATATLNAIDRLLGSRMEWLESQASAASMSSDRGISQGFGVITSVLYARSGLNLASLSDDNSFSISGSASGIHKMLGEAKGSGSFVSTNATKSTDKHLWPSESNTLPASPVPIAFSFASFDGRLLLPRWITRIGSYQLVLRNNHGGTYIVKAELNYDCGKGHQKRTASVSGGLTTAFGDIPLDASNIDLKLEFVCVGPNQHQSFHWNNPRGEWINGVRHIDIHGVWPGPTSAVDAEAGIKLS